MKRILIVDDDNDILEFLEYSLKTLGYEVYLSNRTLNALKIFKKNKIDLAIFDFYIDEKNGLDLSQKILEINPHIPIIIMSGDMGSTIKNKLLSIGVRHVLKRPIKLNILEACLKLCAYM